MSHARPVDFRPTTARTTTSSPARAALRLGGLLTLLALQVGCGDDPPAEEGPPIGTSRPAGMTATGTSASLPGMPANVGAVPGRVERAREILRKSLNTTVVDRSRFESAPLYELGVDIDYDLFTYRATAHVEFVNSSVDRLEELVFFAYPNTADMVPRGLKNLVIDDVTVDGATVTPQITGPRIRIPLPAPLRRGDAVTVDIGFRGNIHRLPPGSSDIGKLAAEQVIDLVTGGSEKSGGYGVFSVGDGIVSLGLWYPILAALDEKGWDLSDGGPVGDVSYFDVANYDVTVTAPRDVAIVSTGVEVERKDVASAAGEGRTRVRFFAGAVREFTLQLSADYEHKSAFVDGVQVTSWYTRGHEATGQRVLDTGREALRLFNSLFGPYPYTELDLVEAPLVGGAGGVEFPGLVTIARMFYTPDVPTPQGANSGPANVIQRAMSESRYLADTLEFVVAHEVAHEWWNAVVGSDSKRHPFVDEALANHSAILYFDRVHGRDAAQTQVDMQLKLPYQIARMAGAADRPVDLPTSEFNGALEYSAIVYGKGALFFDEARRRMGDAAHLAFLRDYYQTHRFRIASPNDLIGAMARAARVPGDIRALADRWLAGTHADDDIGSIRLLATARYLLGDEIVGGEIGQILRLLDHKGVGELTKLVKHIISPDGDLKDGIQWGEIVRLALGVLGETDMVDGELGPLVAIADALAANPQLLTNGSLRGTVKQLAKKAIGADKQTSALIDIADLLLQVLEGE